MTVSSFLLLQLGGVVLGLSKTGFGGGAGVLTTPLFALVMDARKAVGVMLPLLIGCDIMALFYYRGRISVSNVLLLLPPMILGIAFGAPILGHISDRLLKRLIGLMALLFTYTHVASKGPNRFVKGVRPSPLSGFLFGLGAGVASAVAHQGGVLTTMFLLPQRLAPDVFVGTTTVLYFVVNGMKLIPYLQMHLINLATLQSSLWSLPGVLIGALIGFFCNRRLSQDQFSRLVLIIVFVTSVKLMMAP